MDFLLANVKGVKIYKTNIVDKFLPSSNRNIKAHKINFTKESSKN